MKYGSHKTVNTVLIPLTRGNWIVKFTETESSIVIARGWGEGKWGVII